MEKLIETGIDPETGVEIKRDKPIQILGIYQSTLEGNVQKIAGDKEIGIITNLDRSKVEKNIIRLFLLPLFLLVRQCKKTKTKYE